MTIGRAKSALIVAIAMWGFASRAEAQAGADAATKFEGETSVTSSSPVLYYSKQQVDASFEGKAPAGRDLLYDGDKDARPFRIATTARKKPGGGEIHMKLTDVVYILKGTATVVTGGKLSDVIEGLKYPDGKPFPKDEIRGHSVVGGEAHHLAPGDVIIIPNGVPHQFTEVQGPFWYYVVKVRQP